MTRLRQFRVLFGYHATSNPNVWAWMIFFLIISQVGFGTGRYDLDLDRPNSAIMMLMLMPVLVASYVFGAQIYGNGFLQMKGGHNPVFNSEFLLSRAVDRGAVYWARIAVYWSVFLIPVAVWIYLGWRSPSFVLEVTPARLSYYLEMLPGSHIQETMANGNSLLVAPWGGLWLRLWASFVIISSTSLAQLYTFSTGSLPQARCYRTAAYIFCVFAMLTMPLFSLFFTETLFLFGVNHWIGCVIALLGVVGVSLFVSKRRFLDQEF